MLASRLKKTALIVILLLAETTQALCAEIPFILPPKDDLSRLKSATVYTNRGDITFELFPEEAPWHVANFKYLADKGFYRNRPFHLYYPDYIIQAGALRKDEFRLFGYLLPPEFGPRQHESGTLGMARLPDEKNPQRLSSGTQFHILLDGNRRMDHSYTIFGQISTGMDILMSLRKGDVIRDLKVFVR